MDGMAIGTAIRAAATGDELDYASRFREMPGRIELEVLAKIQEVVGRRRQRLDIGNLRWLIRNDLAIAHQPKAGDAVGLAARFQGLQQLGQGNLAFSGNRVIDDA